MRIPKILFEVAALLLILIVVFYVWRYAGQWIDTNVSGFKGADLKTNDIEARGLYGDKFGAVNALFSAFAFAGIIFTIFLQRRDINQTRTAFESQNETANHERFDSTFFQLLTLHNEITSTLSDLESSGKKSFESFNEKLRQSGEFFPLYIALSKLQTQEVRSLRDSKSIDGISTAQLTEADRSNIKLSINKGPAGCDNFLDTSVEMHEMDIARAYSLAATEHIDKYSHYFRNLYHILNFIKESKLIKDLEKSLYIKIVRSQLSETELVALFYNSITSVRLPGREEMELGHPKMGKLLAEFDILQNMSPRSLIHPIHLAIFKKNNPGTKT